MQAGKRWTAVVCVAAIALAGCGGVDDDSLTGATFTDDTLTDETFTDDTFTETLDDTFTETLTDETFTETSTDDTFAETFTDDTADTVPDEPATVAPLPDDGENGTIGVPAAAAAFAPATIAPGAWSPPIASTAMGSMSRGLSRLRRRRGSCTSRRSGRPCAGSSRCRSAGTCSERGPTASTHRRGGCGSSSSTSSSSERPRRVSRI